MQLHQHMHHQDVQQRQAPHAHPQQQQADGTPASTGSETPLELLNDAGDEELHESGRLRRSFGMTHNEEVVGLPKDLIVLGTTKVL